MPFQYILANLLAGADESLGVLFLDESGETVDMACAEMAPTDMKIVGAYVAIYLRQLPRFLDATVYGRPRFLHIESDGLHVFASPLPEGYFLVLVQRNPALVGAARRRLADAAQQIRNELFAQL